MTRPTVLVVFYSRSGHTKKVARALGNSLACEMEELVDETPRGGILGYLRSGLDALLRRPAKLRPLRADPSRFDLVIVGTPVWNASVSAPVRTFLEEHSGRLRRVAFFLTYGGRGRRRVLGQMERLAGATPVSTLAVRERALDGRYVGQVRVFVDDIRFELQVEAAAPGGSVAEAAS